VLSALPPISLFLSCLLPTFVACSKITDKTNPKMGFGEIIYGNSISIGPKSLNGWFIGDFWCIHSTFISSIVNCIIFQWHLDFIGINFILFSNHYRYLHYVFVWKGATSEILILFKTWRDPKTYSTMYKKDMLKDWSSPHLLDYG
jgi:hypothetical protein